MELKSLSRCDSSNMTQFVPLMAAICGDFGTISNRGDASYLRNQLICYIICEMTTADFTR